MSVALTAVDATDLDDLEQTIAKGLDAFLEVGNALETIRDRRLYRDQFTTFEEYVRERWKMSRASAYRQIASAVVVRLVSPIGDTPTPASESVARELVPLKNDPEHLRETWADVVELHGPKPTAGEVREVVKRKQYRKKGDPEYNKRHFDPERVLRTLRQEMETMDAGLDRLQPGQLDGELVDECVAAVRDGCRRVLKHLRRISE